VATAGVTAGLGYAATRVFGSRHVGRMLPWVLGRGLGIAGYLTLVALTAAGLWLRHPWRTRWRRPAVEAQLRLHAALAALTLATVVGHIVALVLDAYAGVGLTGAVVPGVGSTSAKAAGPPNVGARKCGFPASPVLRMKAAPSVTAAPKTPTAAAAVAAVTALPATNRAARLIRRVSPWNRTRRSKPGTSQTVATARAIDPNSKHIDATAAAQLARQPVIDRLRKWNSNPTSPCTAPPQSQAAQNYAGTTVKRL